MNEKLLLTDELIDLLSGKFDDAYDFKEMIKNKLVGVAVEAVDKKVAKIALNFSNIRVSPYIPDEYKDEFQLALADVTDGDKDYTVAVTNAIEVIDQLKDKLDLSPFLTSLLDSLLEMVKAGLLVILEPKE